LTDENLVELEIAAFQGPHIKRARIVLAVVGLIYIYWGWHSYDAIAKLRQIVNQASGPDLYGAKSTVHLVYAVVVSWIVGGIAMFVLAGLAGKKTMLAFYAAVAVFGAVSLLELYASGGGLLTSLVWWMAAICLTLGFIAARKAEALRRTAPAPAI
jgi:hypothetical protein